MSTPFLWKGKVYIMESKVYQKVQDKIIARLEDALKNGTKFQWVKPWSCGLNYACCYETSKPYRGINAVLLDPGEYTTFSKIKALQATKPEVKLKKGSKADFVVYYDVVTKKKDGEPVLDDNGKEIKIPFVKYYNVFHISNVEGIQSKFPAREFQHNTTEHMLQIDKAIDEFINATSLQANFNHGSSSACYIPSKHSIILPTKEQFANIHEYYSTVFHELAHSTGNELGRGVKNTFGSQAYSKEELIAEISASMLCAYFEVEDEDSSQNNVAYVQGWLTHIKDADISCVAKAATQAQKVVDYFLKESNIEVLQETAEETA